jgi:hypothetical protein
MTERSEGNEPDFTVTQGDMYRPTIFNNHRFGLQIDISPTDTTVAQQHDIPEGALVGRVKFAPYGRSFYVGSYKTVNLLAFLQGFGSFFQAIDDGLSEPEFLIGSTNPEMAKASEILGFSTIDDTVGLLGRRCRVINRTSDVRERLKKINARRDRQGRSVLQQLQTRQAFSQRKP